jgi:hypothetical protein
MKTRSLKISGELWVQLLSGSEPKHFRVIRNALPEDAKCVGLAYEQLPEDGPITLAIKITSSVFRDDDPDDLPCPIMQRL